MKNIDKLFDEVFATERMANEIKGFGIEAKIMKLQEELGELATDHLKLIGYKVSDDKPKAVKKNMKEEVVDLFIMTLCVGENLGMTKDDFLNIAAKKIKKWNKVHIEGFVKKKSKKNAKAKK